MTINDNIRDEKLQYDIKREAAKISPLLSGKVNHYEYLTDDGMLPLDKSRVIKHGKFIFIFSYR